jgi:hypothetical protein
VAVQITVLIAAMYAVVLFFKNTFFRVMILYALDVLAVILLAQSGAAETKMVFFIAFGFILNTIIIFLPGNTGEKPVFKGRDFLLLSTALAIPAAYIVLFNGLSHTAALPVPAVKAHPAAFMMFCAAFTALYFVIKEKSGENENE